MVAPVPAVTAAAATTAAPATPRSQIAGNFSDFLKLLMTQLKNQDPTAPLDTNQFTQQLVQFSSVEQQLNTNTSLNKLITLQEGGQVLQSSALVGKTVQVASAQVGLEGGRGTIQFQSAAGGPADVTIYGPSGQPVRTAQVSTAPGTNSFSWDGRDDSGRRLADGAYSVGVAVAGSAVPFTVGGVATAVERGPDGMMLRVAGLKVPLTAVQSVQ